MKKTFLIAVVLGILAAALFGVCGVFAQDSGDTVTDWDQYWEDYYAAKYEKFEYYEKNDYDPHMKPLDLRPVRFYVQDEHDGTYTLTLTLKNISSRSWPAGKYDLLCKRGSDYLAEGSGPRWTIEKETPIGGTTQIVATLKEYVRGGRMVFYVMDGANSFYGFYIRL